MKTDSSKTPDFDLCNDITSGFMMGLCASIVNEKEKATRNKILNSIIIKWSEAQKKVFLKLQNASTEFTKERAGNEVDLSGTARSMFQSDEDAMQEKDFIESLQKLESGKAPKYTTAQWQIEDKKMNLLLNNIQMNKDPWGTVTKDGIKITQNYWQKYRDAWVEFSEIKFPKYSSDSIRTWFTQKRNHMLNSFKKEN